MFAVPAFRRFAITNVRHLSNNTAAGPSSKQSQSSPPKPSDSTPRKPEVKVGPGASKDGDYKNPEYYTYDAFSYANLELEMMKYRMPQPSPKN